MVATFNLGLVGYDSVDSTGDYEFKNIWFTDLVERVEICSVEVQYTDGTSKTITDPKAITMPKQLLEAIPISIEGLKTLK